MTQNIVIKKRDNSGNFKTPLDPLRALVAPYTFNGDIHASGAGKQAFTNANGRNLYITGLYLIENAGAAEIFQIYDGNVATGTKRIDISVAASAEPRMDYVLPLGPFTSTNGIYVATSSTSDVSIVVSVVVDPGVVE